MRPAKKLTPLLLLILGPAPWAVAQELLPLKYNHPNLVVDLGVGLWAWPLPMDYDGDGDYDLVVSCPDKPYNGTYFFENKEGNVKLPVFEAGVRIGPGRDNVRVSYVDGAPRVLRPGEELADFRRRGYENPRKLGLPANVHVPGHKMRANQWHYVDFDGNGALDLLIGVDDWFDYGWDDGYTPDGRWTRGPLRGFVYLARNIGSAADPKYAKAKKLEAGGAPLEVFGWPSPCIGDFDGDGDLDLICGEFLDKLTYFENIGTRQAPKFAAGRPLLHNGQPLAMDLQMIVPTPIDWDRDGDLDLIVGDEDGRVAFIEHTGRVVDGLPQFLPPRYFQQRAEGVKCGALATPVAVDWDGDGDPDILSGNTAGYIEFFENLSWHGTDETPRWAAPRRLASAGREIRIQAGPNGSIQGPCEAKWGYTTLSAADWNLNGLPDLVVNSIWGEVLWYENVGTKREPRLAAPRRIEVEWPEAPPKPAWTWWRPQAKQLVTQWRTTPVVADFTGNGLPDLALLDHEGFLALFERRREQDGSLRLLPGRRIFIDESGAPIRLNDKRNGGSGRRKLHAADWDGDGRLDLLVNGQNAELLRNLGTREGRLVLKNLGPLAATPLAAHDTSPCVLDLNRDGRPDLLVGAEDGRMYYLLTR